MTSNPKEPKGAGPREFWIEFLDEGDIVWDRPVNEKTTHVIEREAYDQALAEIERLKLFIPTMSGEESEYRAHKWKEAAHVANEQTQRIFDELQKWRELAKELREAANAFMDDVEDYELNFETAIKLLEAIYKFDEMEKRQKP